MGKLSPNEIAEFNRKMIADAVGRPKKPSAAETPTPTPEPEESPQEEMPLEPPKGRTRTKAQTKPEGDA